MLLELEDGRVTEIKGDPQCPINKGKLCPKGYASLEYLYHPDRLKRPLKRKAGKGEGRWQSLSWEEALGEISETFVEIQTVPNPSFSLMDRQRGSRTLYFADLSTPSAPPISSQRIISALYREKLPP